MVYRISSICFVWMILLNSSNLLLRFHKGLHFKRNHCDFLVDCFNACFAWVIFLQNKVQGEWMNNGLKIVYVVPIQ